MWKQVLMGAMLLGLSAGSLPAWAGAQEPADELLPGRQGAPLVYVDCGRCDIDFIRQEITFVNHVRDPNLAQIHVLITDQGTGGGGRSYTLFFRGQQEFAGLEQTLTYVTPATISTAVARDGLTEMIKLGLVPYVARTPLASRLRLQFDAGRQAAAAPASDPWNSWTFEVYGGGNFNMESTQRSGNARYGFFADRVTEDWKLRFRPYFNHNTRIVTRNEEEFRSVQHRHGLDMFVIRSLGRHWGAGLFAEYLTTTFDNLRHGVFVRPAIEYSIYPYEQAARRQITFSYRVAGEAVDYFQETIYEKTAETLFSHGLEASVQYRQPWGNFSASLNGSNYLHAPEFYSLSANGNTGIRLGRGVALNIGGSFQRINDQLGLPRGDASLEDILLQRRRLAASYRASGNIGLSYTFGSIFSNVVNPRL
jgi:hypothetical protein